MRTKLIYGDRVIDTRVTRCHMLHMTAFCKSINFNYIKKSVSELISQGNATMKSGVLKSSHQSDIFSISRIYKLGSESRVHLWSRGFVLEFRGRYGPTVPYANIMTFMPIFRDIVGSPSQRAISELCFSVMQITLEVKSASIISSFFPILTLLKGSYKWLVIVNGNSIRVCDYYNIQINSYEVFTYSLDHISSQRQELRVGLIRKILLIYQLESDMAMSDVDFGHMIILCMMVFNTGADMDGEDKKLSAIIGQ